MVGAEFDGGIFHTRRHGKRYFIFQKFYTLCRENSLNFKYSHMGIEISPMCDREVCAQEIAQSQLSFIDYFEDLLKISKLSSLIKKIYFRNSPCDFSNLRSVG